MFLTSLRFTPKLSYMPRYILQFCMLIFLVFAACTKHAKNDLPGNEIDSARIGHGTGSLNYTYPYTDTFFGPCNTYMMDFYDLEWSGTAQICLTYYSKDSILLFNGSRSFGYFPATIIRGSNLSGAGAHIITEYTSTIVAHDDYLFRRVNDYLFCDYTQYDGYHIGTYEGHKTN